MENKALFLLGTVLCSILAIGLIVAGIATDNWVHATAIPPSVSQNSTRATDGEIQFGLFSGKVNINYGNGPRHPTLKVVCDASAGLCLLYYIKEGKKDNGKEDIKNFIAQYKNSTDNHPYDFGLFNFGYWLCTILFSGFAIVWGLVSLGFAFFNIAGKPIETITGPMGLYLWNGLAFLLALVAMVMYLVLFLSYFKQSVLSFEDRFTQKFTSTARLDYSFYFLVGATILYFTNLILLFLSGYKLRCAFTREADKVVDNGIILY